MKMTLEHYNHIKTAIDALPKNQVIEHKAKKLGKDVDMRFRWDLFYAARLSQFASSELYSYLNDDHIDTALRNIVREIRF